MGPQDARGRARQEPAGAVGRRFLEVTDDLLVVASFPDGIMWANAAWKRTLGVDPEQVLGRGFTELIHPDDREKSLAAWQQKGEGGGPDSITNRFRRADGSYRWLLWTAATDVGLIYGVGKDVTELEESQREVAQAASLHMATLEATADGILVVDTNRRVVSFNERFQEMWSLPRELLAVGSDAETLSLRCSGQVRDPEGFLARIQDHYERSEFESIDPIEFKDGRVFERACRPQHIEGEVVGRVWSFRDVTDRVRAERENLALEAQLQQSQRLESLGRLAGGIAHDFNNDLVAILNYAALAGEQAEEGSSARSDLEEVVRAAEHASALTRELVAFSRQEIIEPQPLDLNALIRDGERLLRSAIGEDVEVRLELDEDLPAIEADSSQFERVLMNLAVNSRDAMPDGGTIVIATEGVDPGDGAVRGRLVRFSVHDDGMGMSEDVVSRAVEPFFTTKPSGKGTGLGLATVYGIVNQAGGQLTIDSRPGQGTTVTIDVPAIETPALEKADRGTAGPAPARTPATDRGTLLVVEDEAAVRRLTARLLRDAGFQVLEASGGEEALSALEREGAGELGLLLTDIVMPRMSGRELAERVHKLRPDLPVLFFSGYTDDVVVRHGVASEDLPFLAKPFTRESLLAAVAEAIHH